jgi:hypothetical protein
VQPVLLPPPALLESCHDVSRKVLAVAAEERVRVSTMLVDFTLAATLSSADEVP